MSDEPVTVFVVLDPGFGDRIRDLALRGPVWVTSSAVNRVAVEKLWAGGRGPFEVTYWSEPRSGASEEEWIGILDTLEVHHGEPWAGPGIAAIEVVGVTITAAAEAALHEFGLSVERSDSVGFRAVRTTSPN